MWQRRRINDRRASQVLANKGEVVNGCGEVVVLALLRGMGSRAARWPHCEIASRSMGCMQCTVLHSTAHRATTHASGLATEPDRKVCADDARRGRSKP